MTPNIFLKNMSGIYGIRNITNNKIYVGKTKCMYRRCHQYVYDFEKRAIGHLNDYLFNAMTKSGIDNFEFFPLEFTDIDNLAERELHWMNVLRSTDRNSGYNLRLDSSTGMICHDSTSAKISSNLKRQWSEGVRVNHSSKMKEYWEGNDQRRSDQSKRFSATKTRYEYDIFKNDVLCEKSCDYSTLCVYGLKNVVSNFHRKGSNVANHKGFTIVRKPKGGQ